MNGNLQSHIVIAAFLAVSSGCATGPEPEPADLVILDGKVFLGEGATSAEAVAVRGGSILAVGSSAEIEKHRTEAATVVDARGGTVLAGFNDAHVHFRSGGESLDRVDLFDSGTVEEAQSAIREFAAANPERPWILGRGWLYGAFPGNLPTREQLDAVVSDRPALMTCYDGHTTWVNSKALELAKITGGDPGSADVFSLPVERAKDFEVVTTIFDGKVVYSRE
jgi:hypothetical protein